MAGRYSSKPIAAEAQSSFVPMPIEYIDKYLQREQQKYDMAETTLNTVQTELGKIHALSPDVAKVRATSTDYDSRIDKAVKEAGGDYGQLTNFAKSMGKELQKDLSTGFLGAAKGSYTGYQADLAMYQKMYEKGNLSAARLAQAKSEALERYNGATVGADGMYTGYQSYKPVQDIDLVSELDDIAKNSAVQYDRTGLKYKAAGTMTANVLAEAMKNEDLMEFSRSEVRRIYNPKNKEEAAKYLKQYLTGKARAVSHKRAFHEVDKERYDTAQKGKKTLKPFTGAYAESPIVRPKGYTYGGMTGLDAIMKKLDTTVVPKVQTQVTSADADFGLIIQPVAEKIHEWFGEKKVDKVAFINEIKKDNNLRQTLAQWMTFDELEAMEPEKVIEFIKAKTKAADAADVPFSLRLSNGSEETEKATKDIFGTKKFSGTLATHYKVTNLATNTELTPTQITAMQRDYQKGLSDPDHDATYGVTGIVDDYDGVFSKGTKEVTCVTDAGTTQYKLTPITNENFTGKNVYGRFNAAYKNAQNGYSMPIELRAVTRKGVAHDFRVSVDKDGTLRVLDTTENRFITAEEQQDLITVGNIYEEQMKRANETAKETAYRIQQERINNRLTQ